MLDYLQVRGLVKRYGKVTALAGVDLRVRQGAVLGILGPNGAGKSTLFGCLLGLIRLTNGEIALRGTAITDVARARFGYTPERVSLYPHQSIWENGRFFVGLRGQGAEELELQLRRVGLYEVRERKARELSKGMAQRLGLAIALSGAPELLILDEPFNGLDPVLLGELQSILREEQARGATLLISTHTISAIETLATDIAILFDGALAMSGTIEEARTEYSDAASLQSIYHRIARERRSEQREAVL